MRRWKELAPDLESFGVRVVTLCTDTPEQIRAGRAKHGLEAVMLSDRDLAVTRLFDLENRAVQAKPPGLPGLPIPPTLLVDEEGIVRWIDQAEDYQVRSRPKRVREALRAALA